MIKEIGSIFPLDFETIAKYSSENPRFNDGKIYYSLCREALYDIANLSRYKDNRTVMIPAFTCQTVITPFEEKGWKPIFYPIKRDLRIDVIQLEKLLKTTRPSLIVVHPYFGMDLNEEEENALKTIESAGVEIVIDLTQCIYSSKEYDYCDFKVGSLRKWMNIPDGGFLESRVSSICQPDSENDTFVIKTTDAMYLRDKYFVNGENRLKEISIRLNKEANHIAARDIHSHKISSLSYNILKQADHIKNQARRFENFACLYNNITIKDKNIIKVCTNLEDVTCAPLYFTIYVNNRSDLQHRLAEKSIYAPVIWPVEDTNVLISEDVKYIYNHMLAIPCDQRYNLEDMKRITRIINEYAKEK